MKKLCALSFCLLLPAAVVGTASPIISHHPEPAVGAEAGEWWSSWRGPTGNGVALGGNPPTEWSEEKNVRWKVAVPGFGQSSPVIWGDRIYVTTAIETDEEGKAVEEEPPADEPPRGGRGGGRSRSAPTKIHEFTVLCVDRSSGEAVWSTTVNESVPHESLHTTASQIANSPLTDGEHVYAHFGSRGLHCLDMDGKIVWSKDFGRMRTRNSWGEGSSPALYGDTLVVIWDHEGDSFIVALDKKTGEERWRRARKEQTNWATPAIVPVGERAQVIVPGTIASYAYDLENGKTIWSVSGMTGNCIPTPLHADGMVYLMSGFRGAALQAVRLEGAEGNLADSESVVWSHDQGTSYVPSGLLHDGLVYFLRVNSGSLSCLDAATGEVMYEGERLEGLRTIYSSLVAAGGRIYVTSREGTTSVIAAGPSFEQVATNVLDDAFDASIAFAGDELYLRGANHLYCVAKTE